MATIQPATDAQLRDIRAQLQDYQQRALRRKTINHLGEFAVTGTDGRIAVKSSGKDFQVDWHTTRLELELTFRPDDYFTRNGSTPFSKTLADDFLKQLRTWELAPLTARLYGLVHNRTVIGVGWMMSNVAHPRTTDRTMMGATEQFYLLGGYERHFADYVHERSQQRRTKAFWRHLDARRIVWFSGRDKLVRNATSEACKPTAWVMFNQDDGVKPVVMEGDRYLRWDFARGSFWHYPSDRQLLYGLEDFVIL